MRIFVAGATGVIGQQLLPQLVAQGITSLAPPGARPSWTGCARWAPSR